MWFHRLQPGQTWFSSLTFHQFQYFFFIKLFSLVFSSILLILTHNPSTFCPLHLHSSPLYQITNLINLTLSISPPFIRSCDVSSLRLKLFLCLLRLWLMLVSPELFPSKFICENVFFVLEGGLLSHGGVGMADVAQIGAMWTEHLQMAEDGCQLVLLIWIESPISIKWCLLLKSPAVSQARLHVSCMFVLLHTAGDLLPPGGSRWVVAPAAT